MGFKSSGRVTPFGQMLVVRESVLIAVIEKNLVAVPDVFLGANKRFAAPRVQFGVRAGPGSVVGETGHAALTGRVLVGDIARAVELVGIRRGIVFAVSRVQFVLRERFAAISHDRCAARENHRVWIIASRLRE